MCFVWIWEQTTIISLYNINWLVFITEAQCLLRGTDWIFIYNTVHINSNGLCANSLVNLNICNKAQCHKTHNYTNVTFPLVYRAHNKTQSPLSLQAGSAEETGQPFTKLFRCFERPIRVRKYNFHLINLQKRNCVTFYGDEVQTLNIPSAISKTWQLISQWSDSCIIF